MPTSDEIARARALALDAFGAIAADPELAGALLAAGGTSAEALAAAAHRPEFAAFVLDFVAESDARTLTIARALEVAPERLARARAILSPEGG